MGGSGGGIGAKPEQFANASNASMTLVFALSITLNGVSSMLREMVSAGSSFDVVPAGAGGR